MYIYHKPEDSVGEDVADVEVGTTVDVIVEEEDMNEAEEEREEMTIQSIINTELFDKVPIFWN